MNEKEPADKVSGKRQRTVYRLSLLANLLSKAHQPNQSIRDLERQLRNPTANRPPKPPVR